MFKIDAQPTFRRTVKVNIPSGDGVDEQSLQATFKVLPTSAADLSTVAGTTEFLRAIVVQLDDLVDAAGKPVTYTPAIGDQLFDLPYVRAALATGYFDAVNRVREGN